MRDRSSSVKRGRADGSDTSPLVNQSTVLFEVWLAGRSVLALLDETLSGTGLDAEDFAVYSLLAGTDRTSPTELARWMSAPGTTISSYVKRLEERGHVRRLPNPSDGRSHRLELTVDGRLAFAHAGARFQSILQQVEDALDTPPAHVQAVLRELRQAVDTTRTRAGR